MVMTVVVQTGLGLGAPDARADGGADTLGSVVLAGSAVESTYVATNIGSVTGTATDGDGDVAIVTDEDRSHRVRRTPSVDLVKVFEDDEVTAGGPASSFELRVTNTGDIALADVTVTDSVDPRLTVTGVDCDGASGGVSQDVSCVFPSLAPDATAVVTVVYEVAAGVLGATAAAVGDGEPAPSAETCPPRAEPNRYGVCTSRSIRPIASCWQPDGTQAVEIVNVGSTTIGVWWDYHDLSGRVEAPPGSTSFTLTGGPSSGELRVRWSHDQAWYLDITGEPCAPDSLTIDNTAAVTAVSAVGTVGDGDSDSVVVVGGEPNEPPMAAFAVECAELECSFVDESTDADGTIVAWGWDFGDGTTSGAQHPGHVFGASGTYPVTLTVTDQRGATATVTHPVTVSEHTMHVGDIDSIAISQDVIWDAFVIVTIVDDAGAAVEGATVSGEWSTAGADSCVTGATGTCAIARYALRVSAERFTVTDVTHDSLVYDPSENTDPDGDSDGTSIGLRRP